MNTSQISTSTAPIEVAVTRTVDASADTLYALVTDITRMPEWSRETIATRWLDGATGAEVGARFAGKNRLGRNSWTTKPTIVAADCGQGDRSICEPPREHRRHARAARRRCRAGRTRSRRPSSLIHPKINYNNRHRRIQWNT